MTNVPFSALSSLKDYKCIYNLCLFLASARHPLSQFQVALVAHCLVTAGWQDIFTFDAGNPLVQRVKTNNNGVVIITNSVETVRNYVLILLSMSF